MKAIDKHGNLVDPASPEAAFMIKDAEAAELKARKPVEDKAVRPKATQKK